MALLFYDGFDASNLREKWDLSAGSAITIPLSIVVDTTAAYVRRTGNYVFRIAPNSNSSTCYGPVTSITSSQTIIGGFAFKIYDTTNNPTYEIFSFSDLAGTQISIVYAAAVLQENRKLYVYRGNYSTGTLIGTSSTTLIPNTWYYIELKAYINSGTSGTFELRVNGVNVASSTGCNTQGSTSLYATKFGLLYKRGGGSVNGPWYCYDDVYVCNDSGTTCNDFLGDQRIDNVMPDGAGYQTDWTPNTAVANYTTVDEVGTITTDYIYAHTLNSIDSYTYAALPTETPAITYIRGVQQNIWAKRNSVGVVAKIKPFVRISGTNYYGTEQTLERDYYYMYRHIWETNPSEPEGTLWTKAAIDAAEFGVILSDINDL